MLDLIITFKLNQLINTSNLKSFYTVNDIFKINYDDWRKNYQSIFFNVDWNKYSFENFKDFKLPKDLISNGLFFIWGKKELITEINKKMESMNFKMVETLSVVFLKKSQLEKDLKKIKEKINYFFEFNNYGYINNNTFYYKRDKFFKKCKLTLFIYRKYNKYAKLELRHQRNNDIILSIYDKDSHNGISVEAMNEVYKRIETLLPKSNTNKIFGCVQISGNICERKGWITILEEKKKKK